MSRTYRCNKRVEERGLVQQINKDLDYYYRRPYTYVSVKLSEEEVAAENARRQKEYRDQCEEYANTHNCSIKEAENATYTHRWRYLGIESKMYVISRPWPAPKTKSVKVPLSKESVVEQSKRDYAKHRRDGHWNESGRNKAFKLMAKRNLRSEWKRTKQQILKDEDYDYDKPYPHNFMGKKFIWSVW